MILNDINMSIYLQRRKKVWSMYIYVSKSAAEILGGATEVCGLLHPWRIGRSYW